MIHLFLALSFAPHNILRRTTSDWRLQRTMTDQKEKNTQDANKTNSSILPITPDREKMSRALGAAFLQHKVQQLERNLDDLSFRRDIHPPDSRRSQSKKKTLPTACSPSPPPIKLIDTSMLIHALPILKKWVRQAKFRIVIPLDGKFPYGL